MSAVDFAAWALEDLEVTLRGRTYLVRPPSVEAGKKILAAALRGEVRLGIEKSEIPAEVQAVLDSIKPTEHPALGEQVYEQMVADGISQVEIDRVSYYAVFYWARGKEYADKLATALWALPSTETAEAGEAAPKA